MKFFYTYVLQLRNNDLYVGYCSNIKNRINEHASGKVDATRNARPVKLVYFEGCLSEKSAIKREKQLKTGFGRSYIKRRIK